jgi:DNA invertase Pin-like site-specific DNA recombinase
MPIANVFAQTEALARQATTSNGEDLNESGQFEAVKAAGAAKILKEKISGVRADRPQLAKLMHSLLLGDIVVVTKLDRLGGSIRKLLDLIDPIDKAGAAFRR